MDRQQRRAHRRNGLAEDFRRHDKRRAILHGRFERAKSVHAAAKAAFDAAEDALARASGLYDGAERDCIELRHLMALDPDTINGLPVELLDAVFVALVNEPDPLWPNIEDAEYNESRALLPYRLSAVCRHWRRVALANSALWTYVACFVRSLEDPRLFLSPHLALQLERSRSLPIDVCLDFHIYLDHHDPFIPCWEDVLSLVIDHAWRWRRVTIRLTFAPSTFEQLMSPKDTPLLEELRLHGHSSSSTMIDLSWISQAPSLRKLCMPDIPFNVATATSTVVSATAFGMFNALHNLPHLESLSLIVDELPSAAPGPISLPLLKSLTLQGGEEIFQCVLALPIVAPQLKRLHIDRDDFSRGAAPSAQDFVRAFPSITDLEIQGSVSAGNADLALFSRIKRLSLTGHLAPNYLYTLRGGDDDTPAGRLCVCPELESLTVRDPPRDLEYILSPLAPFIWERAAACRARNVRFRASFESWPAWPKPPSWFRQLLGAAFGPSNVRLTSSDGTTYDPVGDSDEEEEEAVFTDPDESLTASDDESEDYDSDGAVQGMRVNGSDWETDSGDMDYADGDD